MGTTVTLTNIEVVTGVVLWAEVEVSVSGKHIAATYWQPEEGPEIDEIKVIRAEVDEILPCAEDVPEDLVKAADEYLSDNWEKFEDEMWDALGAAAEAEEDAAAEAAYESARDARYEDDYDRY